MACLCGDIACPSCGPAQGFDPDYQAFTESMCERFPQQTPAEMGTELTLLDLFELDWFDEFVQAVHAAGYDQCKQDAADAALVEEDLGEGFDDVVCLVPGGRIVQAPQ